jgi:type IV secretory pathway VirB10-like protein
MPEKNERIDELENSSQLRATVENRASKPAGLLPKNTQQLVILGVAIVMVSIMWITGATKRPRLSAPGTPPTGAVQAPNHATVQEFKQTIQREQAATRQPISPVDLLRLQAMGLAGDVPPGSALVPPDSGVPQPGAFTGGAAAGQQAPPPPDLVKEDKKKREYLSLFAPNVAFTYRRNQDADSLSGPQGGMTSDRAFQNDTQAPPPPSSGLAAQINQAQAQMAAVSRATAQPMQKGQHSLTVTPSEQRQEPKETAPANLDFSALKAFNFSTGEKYVVFEGTVLETLLVNRLDGSYSGPVTCLVTSNVYSHDRQRLLIPSGTKVLGEADKVEAFGQQRLAVVFHRLIMPDGFSVSLDGFKGLSQIGETALRDKVNNHYLQIFGASLAVGILGGVAEAGPGNVLTNSPLEQARAGFGSSLASSSEHILDRFLNILPKVTIREGNRVKVYLSGDLLLPDYGQHSMQPEI